MKDIIKKLKEINKMFYINNYHPNYINKWVFRIGFIIILCGVFYITYNDGLTLQPHAFIECKEKLGCSNPFYSCQNQSVIFQDFMLVDCEPYNKLNCVDNVCSKEFLQYNEYLGVKPSELYKKFGSFVLSIILITFAFNHLLYLYWRSKK